ncbi:MAG: hypothetical protein GF372_13300 [Candidatus Marinimicrobia bacterium]|nr:hypothetical protein [Candidatus Neomarinimicrobiota bacterium]
MQPLKLIQRLSAGIFSRLIFYPYCLVDDHPLPDGEKLVCQDCLKSMPVNPEPHRPSNWEPSANSPIREVWSYWDFSAAFQTLAHALKYQKMPSLGVKLGRFAADSISSYIFPPIDSVIPIPLHKTRMRERGYNQAEHIARGLASSLDISILVDTLLRTQYTKTQTKLNREERRTNLQSAFSLNSRRIENIQEKHILLVDDVFTTGATMETAADILLENGAGKIYGFTLATARLRHHMESDV